VSSAESAVVSKYHNWHSSVEIENKCAAMPTFLFPQSQIHLVGVKLLGKEANCSSHTSFISLKEYSTCSTMAHIHPKLEKADPIMELTEVQPNTAKL